MKCYNCNRQAEILDPLVSGGFTGACWEHSDFEDDMGRVPLNEDIYDVSGMD